MHLNKLGESTSFYTQLNTENVIVVIRLLVGAFFIFAGGAKFWSVSSFSETLAGYSFLPQILILPVSYGIPLIEIAGGLLLLVAWRVSTISLSLLVMVFIFTVAAFVKYQNGQVVNCGCFGELLERKNTWLLFVENAILMFLLGIMQFKSK